MVVSFCVQRLKLQRTCILEGAQRIYTSEKFAILRFCMFTYQLDLGSLAIWQYSLRTSCDYLRGAPGSAALHDASWRVAWRVRTWTSAALRKGATPPWTRTMGSRIRFSPLSGLRVRSGFASSLSFLLPPPSCSSSTFAN